MSTSYAVAVGIDIQSDDAEEQSDGTTIQSYDAEEPSDGTITQSNDAEEPSDGTNIQSYDAEEPSDGTDVQSYDTEASSYDADILSYYNSLDGEDVYRVINGGSGFSVTVNPGEGIFFMTTISNSDLTEKNISLYLTGTSYSKSLQGAVQIGVLKENSDGTTETAGIEVPDDLVTEKTEGGDTLCYLKSVQLVKDVTIPAGNDTSPGTATIKWYIWLDGRKVESACQNAGLVIGQLQIVAKE
jgi:hypothetical protein